MKHSSPHIIALKRLQCKRHKFTLAQGVLIFLNKASMPMLEWLQEVHLNDSEALFGDTDTLMNIPSRITRIKPKENKQTVKKRVKRQLYFRLKSLQGITK